MILFAPYGVPGLAVIQTTRDSLGLEGKVAIVTGGGGDIGSALVSGFAKAGAGVVAAGRTVEKVASAAARARKQGVKAVSVQADVSNQDDVKRLFAEAYRGLGRIDVLVNAASNYALVRRRPFDEFTVEDWLDTMKANVISSWLCAKAAFPYMKLAGKGKIVNLLSSTLYGPVPNNLPYTSSKAALLGLTRALAKELGPFSINVNAVTPGLTITTASRSTVPEEQFANVVNRRAIKREEIPEDVVGAVLFLSSGMSDFITGQTILVDGGGLFV